jgi:hypothetical protein
MDPPISTSVRPSTASDNVPESSDEPWLPVEMAPPTVWSRRMGTGGKEKEKEEKKKKYEKKKMMAPKR